MSTLNEPRSLTTLEQQHYVEAGGVMRTVRFVSVCGEFASGAEAGFAEAEAERLVYLGLASAVGWSPDPAVGAAEQRRVLAANAMGARLQ